MTKDGYEVYVMYLALQRHFSTNYDYFLYNGKIKASTEAYSKRNDLFSFEKITKIVKKEDREDFFVAHFLDNSKEWIKNMSKQKFEEYKATYKNFPIRFKQDMEFIKMNNPSSLIWSDTNQIPTIHKYVLDSTLSIESIIMLDRLFPFIDNHDELIKVPFVWPDYINKIRKYRPFVHKKLEDSLINIKDVARSVLL
jgi:hypothetical protein